MAEDIHTSMQRWLAYVEDHHIDEWAAGQQRVLDQAEDQWREVGQAPERLETVPAHVTSLEEFRETLAADRTLREREGVAIPAGAHLTYYAWVAAREARDADVREPDAAAFGWAAEQRFYQEQDPRNEWYREDLYHGAPGPDVAADWANGPADARPYDTQYPGMRESPPDRIEIDTSDPDLGSRWQDQLAAFEARMDALVAQEATPDVREPTAAAREAHDLQLEQGQDAAHNAAWEETQRGMGDAAPADLLTRHAGDILERYAALQERLQARREAPDRAPGLTERSVEQAHECDGGYEY